MTRKHEMDISGRVREALNPHIGTTSNSLAHRLGIEPWRVRMALESLLAHGEVTTCGTLDYTEWKLS